MKESQLLSLFNSLNKKEIRDLNKWLQSPFFNQRTDVILLFDYLKSHAKKKDDSLDKEKVFASLWKGEIYEDTKIRYAMSFLFNQIKDYLTYVEWKNEAVAPKSAKARALWNHNQDASYQKEMEQLTIQLSEERNFTYLQHFHVYQLNLEKYRSSLKKSRTNAGNLQEVSDALTTFYICETIRVASLMLTHKTVNTQVEYSTQMLEEVLQKAVLPPFVNLPEVSIYYNIYRALSETDNPVYFKNLKKLITTHWQRFAAIEMRDIYLLAINYCIKKLNSGQPEFIREALDLYQVGLEKGIFLDNGELSRFTYNNALTLYLYLKEFEAAKEFLERYKKHLPKKQAHNIYLYNLTVYHFKKQEYQTVMELLQEVRFRDVLYNLDARRMLLRAYFESESFDALESLLDSFQTFMRRRYDLGYHKEMYVNLIRFMRRLLTIGYKREALKALYEEVEKTTAVVDKVWLLEKIEEW